MNITVRVLIFAFLFLYLNSSWGQDFTGRWEGYLNHVSCLNTSQHLKVLLNLTKEGNKYKGTIGYYLVLTGTDINNHAPIFEFPVLSTFQERAIAIEYMASQELHGNFFVIGYYIMGRYSVLLDYKKVSETETLEGLYRGGNGGKGLLSLQRQSSMVSSSQSNATIIAALRKRQQMRKQAFEEEKTKREGVKPKPVWTLSDSLGNLYAKEQLSVQKLQTRKDSVFDVVEVREDLPFITIEIFDNAEIDGDSISVFVGDILVVHNIGLSAKPLEYKLFKPVTELEVSVRIVAENLGSIPPNTALVQIQAGEETKRLMMQADEQKNGSIIFKWIMR